MNNRNAKNTHAFRLEKMKKVTDLIPAYHCVILDRIPLSHSIETFELHFFSFSRLAIIIFGPPLTNSVGEDHRLPTQWARTTAYHSSAGLSSPINT